MNHVTVTDSDEAKRAARVAFNQETIEFIKLVVWFLVLYGILRTFVIELYEVQGDSMVPTLTDRERILVFKLPHNLSRIWPFHDFEAFDEGDIVVFDSKTEPDKRYVKRVVVKGPVTPRGTAAAAARNGEEGDPSRNVLVKFELGKVFVNDKRIKESYLPLDAAPCSETYPNVWRVPPLSYYVLGDNRPISKDSRSFGVVDDGRMIGRAVFRFWPLRKLGPL